jgi:PTS system nitrogen regulatory IIA component
LSSLIPVYTQVYKEPVAFQKALGYAFEGLVNAGVSFDALPAWKAIEKRVGEGIYMGSGLLLPHTRIQGLKSPLMAFAVAPEIQGIAVPQNEVAQFLCLLLSPQESATAHTVAIAGVAKLMLDPAWKAQALACESSDLLKELFRD